MAFWSRISESKVKHLYSQFKSVPYGSLLNSSVSQTKPCVSKNPFLVFHNKPNGFGNSVRFFAAPVQVKQKEEKDTSGPRINEKITAEVVRLVMENEHVIVSRHEALNRARELNVDLVEVQGGADPPVCKLMDFHKEKYQKKVREKDRAKIQSQANVRLGTIKEVRFSGKTEQKDLQMKADMVQRLMEQGYRVKCTAKGSSGQELTETLSRLSSLSALIEDIVVVESGPQLGKDSAYMIVRHVKYGQSKKGGGKKNQALGGDISLGNKEVTSNSNPAIDSCGPIQDLSPAEPGSEAEDEILLDEVDKTKRAKRNKYPRDNTEGVTSNPTAKPVFDSTKADTKPSQPEVPDRTENRYKKNEAVNRFATTKGMDDRGLGARDSVRLQPQFSNQGRQVTRENKDSVRLQPQISNQGRQVTRENNDSVRLQPQFSNQGRQVTRENKDSVRLQPQFSNQGRQVTRDNKDSVRLQPQFSNQGRQVTGENKQAETKAPVFRNSKLPLNDSSKQEPSSPNSPATPSPSYGIFSAHNANAPEK